MCSSTDVTRIQTFFKRILYLIVELYWVHEHVYHLSVTCKLGLTAYKSTRNMCLFNLKSMLRMRCVRIAIHLIQKWRVNNDDYCLRKKHIRFLQYISACMHVCTQIWMINHRPFFGFFLSTLFHAHCFVVFGRHENTHLLLYRVLDKYATL